MSYSWISYILYYFCGGWILILHPLHKINQVPSKAWQIVEMYLINIVLLIVFNFRPQFFPWIYYELVDLICCNKLVSCYKMCFIIFSEVIIYVVMLCFMSYFLDSKLSRFCECFWFSYFFVNMIKMLILRTSGGLREGYLSWGVTVQ